MTRAEFLDYTWGSWCELKDFCYENNLPLMDDILVDDEELDDYVDSQLQDLIDNETWRGVMDTLNNIPTGYEAYKVYDGVYDICALGDGDFGNILDDILQLMDTRELWDEEDEEDEELDMSDFVVEEDEEEEVEDDTPDFDLFLSEAQSEIRSIQDKETPDEEETSIDVLLGEAV